jgi:hypothetical protein
MMAPIVYLLCAVTSALCAVLLSRRYRAARTSFLLWSSLCFTGLAINNGLLFIDLVIVPDGIDLSVPRTFVALAAMLVMLYGLIWEVH